MVDIVERLREPVDDMFFGKVIEPIKCEAADEIERLRGIINDDRLEGAADEIERLRERDGFIAILDKQIVEKDAEIERLREALWEIWYLNASHKDNSIAMATIAYSALQQKESE